MESRICQFEAVQGRVPLASGGGSELGALGWFTIFTLFLVTSWHCSRLLLSFDPELLGASPALCECERRKAFPFPALPKPVTEPLL